MSAQVPKSVRSVSFQHVAAIVTTIAVIFSFFRKLDFRRKSRDKRCRAGNSDEHNPHTPQPQPVDRLVGGEGYVVLSQALLNISEPQSINRDARDERNPQVSTTKPGDHSSGDEGHLGFPQAPPTVSGLGDRDTRSREATQNSKPGTSIASTAIDQINTPFITPENPSINREGEDVQNTEAGREVVSIPKGAPAITTVDRVEQRNDALSTSFFQGSKDVEITGSNFYEVHGDATIIRFGDGQFTDIQRNLICDYIANLAVLPNITNNLRQHVLTQSIISLPRAEAVFNDYQTKKKSGPCFGGTRMALLREMADWVTLTGPDESRMYVLSGLAGIGKSTVAYTIASRAADLNLLGASFFFSRDEADRNSAKRFFTTIAYQLCVYDETFAKAIGEVLKTERGSAATTKDPQIQLKALILDPLRTLIQSRSRPILIVIDALDECDDEDAFSVLSGLNQLVRSLPSFKVILTTRPQPYLDVFLASQGGLNILRLQDIEDKVVDGDIRVYLKHTLSLEQVRKHYPKRQWYASDEEIHSLVHAAGRLFIIASTAVRYILDKATSNPAAQMQKLLRASAQDHTPFKDLNHFYTVILRNVVPDNCDDDGIVSRYQSVVGAIILVQRPLPVSTLAHLIKIDVDDIRSVLDNLQSVILLGSDDVPHVYHKSFPDYLTDQSRCKDPHLLIDTRTRHTQIGICCFGIMDQHLKRNILGLGDPAQFMNNEDGLNEDGITEEQLQEKIPQHLQYTCVYWANHLEVANIEDADLVNGLSKFTNECILYWIEVLSLIGKLDSAHHAIRVVLKLLNSTPSNLCQLLSDALRFISKFYKLIERSALHTYHSALPFAPTNSLLYHRYIEETGHNVCGIEGGPEEWDTLVANLSHEEHVEGIKFSLDNTLFMSCSKDHGRHKSGNLKIWDAATGIPISTIPGHTLVVAKDFSTVASSEDNSITYCNVNGSTRGTMFTTSSKIQKLAISSENHRIAAGLADGTVWLWDSESAKLINNFDGLQCNGRFQFSPTGTRLAYSSANGIIKLRDGLSGRFIIDVRCRSADRYFEFSGDGSRIASVSSGYSSMILWNSKSGEHIGAVTFIGQHLAISANGSLLAATDPTDQKVKLWSESRDSLAQIKVLDLDKPRSMAFSPDNILSIAAGDGIRLYNVTTHSFISTLPFGGEPTALTFSPDSSRLAVGTKDSRLYLWDIKGVGASSSSSKETTTVTALALSRDCSRLACGFVDGRVELWGTSPTVQRIVLSASRWIMDTVSFRIYRHPRQVTALGFSPDGRLFASGSDDGTIKLWNSRDGSLHGTVKASGLLLAVAVSNRVLVVGCDYNITLWGLDTLSLIHTSKESGGIVSIAENSALIAVARDRGISLLDALKHTTIATFDIPYKIHTLTFLPDNSQLVAQSYEDGFLSLNLYSKHLVEGATPEHLIQLPDTPLWHGVPILRCQDKMQHYFSALFSQHKSPVPVLWIPRDISVSAWAQGSSMIALSYEEGRVMLVRLHTSHVG